MSGLTITLTDIEFAQSLGVALPVTRGLTRFYLPGSSAGYRTDMGGSGVAATHLFSATNYSDSGLVATRENAWHIDFLNDDAKRTVGQHYPNIPAASPPKPPASMIVIGRGGVSIGNSDGNAKSSSIAMDTEGGVFGCQGATFYASPGTPSLNVSALSGGAFQTEFNFYGATWDWSSGGQQSEKLYYGRGNALTSAAGSQAADVQTGNPGKQITSSDRNAPNEGAARTYYRGLAAVIIHSVKLTDPEMAATYQWLRRYFEGRLPNNGL